MSFEASLSLWLSKGLALPSTPVTLPRAPESLALTLASCLFTGLPSKKLPLKSKDSKPLKDSPEEAPPPRPAPPPSFGALDGAALAALAALARPAAIALTPCGPTPLWPRCSFLRSGASREARSRPHAWAPSSPAPTPRRSSASSRDPGIAHAAQIAATPSDPMGFLPRSRNLRLGRLLSASASAAAPAAPIPQSRSSRTSRSGQVPWWSSAAARAAAPWSPKSGLPPR
mmetsp:Transcript_40681/g.91456  ORF Transcript_40681/g.91456 Transcript_40681/m.91456 type:complete len:229 (+) Transcript_40681:1164-1850(+)